MAANQKKTSTGKKIIKKYRIKQFLFTIKKMN